MMYSKAPFDFSNNDSHGVALSEEPLAASAANPSLPHKSSQERTLAEETVLFNSMFFAGWIVGMNFNKRTKAIPNNAADRSFPSVRTTYKFC